MNGPEEPEKWESLQAFSFPRESLAACSECVEAIQLRLGIDPVAGPEPSLIKLRVWDRRDRRLILWEDQEGALHWDALTLPDATPFQPGVKQGVNINDSRHPCSAWILDGIKTIETRDSPSLRVHLGSRVGVIRTGRGASTLLGYVTIASEKRYTSLEDFDRDYQRHWIRTDEPGFRFPSAKFGYILEDPVRTAPLLLPKRKQGVS